MLEMSLGVIKSDLLPPNIRQELQEKLSGYILKQQTYIGLRLLPENVRQLLA